MMKQTSKADLWRDILKCLGLLVFTGLLDFITGYDISFFLFYLVPIIFTLRRLGKFYALGMCALSILTWYVANTSDGQTHVGWLSPVWSMMLRFLIFVLVVGLLIVRGRLEHEALRYSSALAREKLARRRLEQEVLEASEREQRKIGHDLHDSLCQQLTASALAGKVLANKLKTQSRPEAAAADQLAGMVEKGIELTRMLARSLRPIELKPEGLADGLRELAANVSVHGRVHCTVECAEPVCLETEDANTHLYRIAQEAVGNAIRHGHAKNVAIELKRQAGNIKLIVTDDGAGLSSDVWTKDSLGLQIMEYRAGMIDGKIKVELSPGGRTQVACTLPGAAAAIFDADDE